MKGTSVLRTSKVTRVSFGAFAIFMVFTLIGAGYRPGMAASSKKEARAESLPASKAGNAAMAAQDGGQSKPQIIDANTLTNSTPITIPSAGAASPYPSNIVVSGYSPNATITSITLTINSLTHTEPDDLDMLLVGPTGARIIFWSDVGGAPTATNVTVTISDAAASSLPDAGPLVSGTFKPTDPVGGAVDSFPSPAPCAGGGCDPGDTSAPEGTATLANRFNGTNPNGTWSLYVFDDSAGDTGTINGGWSLTISVGPTLARMSGGSATVNDDGQVALKWQTSYEVDNLGFNVYRDEGGERVRVNKQLIAGSAFLSGQGTALRAGRSYRWSDTQSKGGPPAQYWIEAVGLDGGSTWHGPISAAYSPGKSGVEPQSLTLGDLGRSGGGAADSGVTASSVSAEASGQSAFKLSVKQTGYYRVTQADLARAGLSAGVNPRNLQLFEDGRERPIIVQGEQDGRFDSGDAIEFYGTAPDNAYTDAHVYRLVAGSEPGLRIKPAKGKSATAGPDGFPFTAELKERNIYFSSLRNGEQENFFGAVVAREPVTRALKLQNVGASSAPATLEVALQGVSLVPHNVKVILNGADVGSVIFDGQSQGVARINVPQSSLKEGDNTVELVALGGDTDVSLMDALRVSYWHGYAADNNSLRFTAPADGQVTIAGFSNSAIRVLDLSNADKGGLKELAGAVRQDGNGYSVTVSVPGEGARTLLAFASDQVKSPASIIADTPSGWRKHNNKADLVIFTRRDFFPALEPLKVQREGQGYRVAVVDVEDVYDEFSNGNKTPQALKDFLAYATSSWKVKPRFALFAGDASLDPKNYLGAGDFDIIPTKLIDTQLMETASDDWFADFNGDGLPEMAVGRLPVRSAQEMSALVGKIVGYESLTPADTMLLISDVSDTFNFGGATQRLRPLFPSNLKALEIDRDTTDDATSRAQLLDYLNQGQRVINYIGHGNLDVWRGDIFTSEDASSLTNSEHLSLFVSMTCLNAYFQDTAVESIAEALVKAPNGGAVAAWASTGMCEPAEQSALNQEFYRLLFGTGSLTIGEAAMKSKSAVKDNDIRRTWVLLGDPTTRLR
jgi:subtilisin-like proprotein convertase family protein